MWQSALPARFRPAYAAAGGRPVDFWLMKAEHVVSPT